MNLRQLSQFFSFRDIRNAAIGLLMVSGGIILTGITIYAHQIQDRRLAGITAGLSLVFVLLILIFVVPPLARNATKEASQLNLPFEFTLGGAIMVALILIVGFSAWSTNNNLLFLILAFLIGAMAAGFFAGGICLQKLDVKMRFPETIFAGEKTPVSVTIINRKRFLPAISVVVEVRGNERERSIVAGDLERILPSFIAKRLSKPPIIRRTLNYFVYIPRKAEIDIKSDQIFERRGRFVIKDFELSTRFPFGFFRHRRRLMAKETELIVMPQLADVDDLPQMSRSDAGQRSSVRVGQGSDLLGMRDYRPNDDLRKIDWKATARRSELIIREFAVEDSEKVTVFIDRRVLRDTDDQMTIRQKIEAEQAGEGIVASKRFEKGVSLSAAVIADFFDSSSEVRLIDDLDSIDHDAGRRHIFLLLQRLAAIEPEFVERFDDDDSFTSAIDLAEINSDDNRRILITSAAASELSPEIRRNWNVVSF